MSAADLGDMSGVAAPTASTGRPVLRIGASTLSLGLASLFVLAFALVPFALVVAVSFGHKVEGAGWEWALTLEQYHRFLMGIDYPASVSSLYLWKLFYTLYYAVLGAVIAVLVAFPFTFALTGLSRRAQTVWLVFLLSSVSLSEIFVVMGWDILMSNRSGLPALVAFVGLTQWLKDTGWMPVLQDWGYANPRNIQLKPSSFATILTMVYLVFPYAIILLYPALSRLDRSLLDAARTMGAGPVKRLTTVIVPLVRVPLAGTGLLLFVFLLGAYVTPSVFSDPSRQTLPISIYETIRGITLNTPFGAVQAVILLVTAAVCVVVGTRWTKSGAPA